MNSATGTYSDWMEQLHVLSPILIILNSINKIYFIKQQKICKKFKI